MLKLVVIVSIPLLIKISRGKVLTMKDSLIDVFTVVHQFIFLVKVRGITSRMRDNMSDELKVNIGSITFTWSCIKSFGS